MTPNLRFHPVLAAVLGAFSTAPALAADVILDPVSVTGSRAEQRSFDLPAAIDVVGRERLDADQPRVNASEVLASVPGLTALNRQNYAQDLQLSSRGFGARSAFGVRGIRLVADGIPASMPDGQGQAATFNLDRAERIEVLRGPLSAVYGNHAGGVIQLFTEEGHGRPVVEGNFSADPAKMSKALGIIRPGGAIRAQVGISFPSKVNRIHNRPNRNLRSWKLRGHEARGILRVRFKRTKRCRGENLGIAWNQDPNIVTQGLESDREAP